MKSHERRTAIWYTLCRQRHTTISFLAEKYNVSFRTIRYDIDALSRTYPIITKVGKGGGICLAYWYQPKKMLLEVEQMDFLLNLAQRLSKNDAAKLNEIISRLSDVDRP